VVGGAEVPTTSSNKASLKYPKKESVMKKNLQVAMHLLLATGMCVAACGNGDAPRVNGTWAIDCVAVVGAPVSELTPLSAVPYSGVPRDKLISELTDDELLRLSDFLQCITGNGYHYVCDHAKSSGRLDSVMRVESPMVLTNYVTSCARTPDNYMGGNNAPEVREEMPRFYRTYYGSCLVGIYEDCNREVGILSITGSNHTPSCDAWEQSCIY